MKFDINTYEVLEFDRNIGDLTVYKGFDKSGNVHIVATDGNNSIVFKGPNKNSKDCDEFIKSVMSTLEKGNFPTLCNL